MSQKNFFSIFSQPRDWPAILLIGVFVATGLLILYVGIRPNPYEEPAPASSEQEAFQNRSLESEKVESLPFTEEETFKEPMDLGVLDTSGSAPALPAPTQPAPTQPAAATPVPTNSPPTEAPSRMYYLVAGTFDDLPSATQSASSLAAKGYDAKLMYPAPGATKPYRVFIFRDENRETVEAFQKNLDKKIGWVMEGP